MSGEPEVRKPMGTYDLCRTLETFVSDNTRSHELENRWLTSVVQRLLEVARNARNGALTPDEKKSIAAFRITEIDKARHDRQREIDALDREARKLASGGDEE